jgi:hypothetical protein
MTRVADRFTAGFDAEVVRAWIADDPDPQTATTLEHILAEAEAGMRRPWPISRTGLPVPSSSAPRACAGRSPRVRTG